MLADLERLIELQEVDLRHQEVSRRLELFPQRRAQAEAERAQARDTLTQQRDRHTEALKQRKKLEIDVQQFDERISKHKGQIYEVKSNEAYRALQQEIEGEEQRKTEAEDRVLEAMIDLEELEKQIKASEAELARVEQRVTGVLRQLGDEQTRDETEARELAAERERLRGQVDEEMLAVYDRIAHAHAGIALAQARDEVCQVCRIHIRPQTYAEVKRNDQIHYCESCHRILYYVPVPPPGVEQAVEAGG